jgi:Protein of unknown function (DUF4239)
MSNWLHTLSNYQIGFLFIVSFLSVSMIIPALIRYKFNLDPRESIGNGADESYKMFITLVLVMIGFSLVQLQGDHKNVEDLVSREATLNLKIGSLLNRYASEDATQAKGALVKYVQSIIDDEWPELQNDKGSDITAGKLKDLTNVLSNLNPQSNEQDTVKSDIDATLTQVVDIRDARIATTRLYLQTYLWGSLSCFLVVMIFFGWFINPLSRMIFFVGGVTLGISMLISLIFILEDLYRGESALLPKPFSEIIPIIMKPL